jgi:mono/diheme cytochrome c family protein
MTYLCNGFGRALVASGVLLVGCAGENGKSVPGARADVRQGAIALHNYGCGACHIIPGVAGAYGVVGPPLVDMGERVYIGRGLPNAAENMIRWIRAPQEIAPRSAMPDMRVTVADAKSMTAYLYSHE